MLSRSTQPKSPSVIRDLSRINAIFSSVTLDISPSPEDGSTLSESQSNHIPFTMSSIPNRIFLAIGAIVIFVVIAVIITVVVILFS